MAWNHTGRFGDQIMTNLDELRLGGTKITDVSLFNLKGFTKLQSLFLENTNVTDAGLAHLNGLTSLNQLNLFN